MMQVTSRPKLYMLIGIPAVGKSTWIGQNREKLELANVLSTDDIIQNIADQYDVAYDKCFGDLIGFAQKIFENQCKLAGLGDENIAIDRTNLTRKGRKKILAMFPNHQPVAVIFKVAEDVWRKRVDGRVGKSIPEPILDSMMRSYQVPDGTEFEEIIHVET